MREKLSKLKNVYEKYGFLGFCRKLYAYLVANYLDQISFSVLFQPGQYRRLIRQMLSGYFDRIILWRSSFGYDVPLFQRPQHIARELSRQRCLVIYEVSSMTDRCKTLRRQEENLWLFNFNNRLLRRLLMQELKRCEQPKYVQLYSTDWKLSVSNIEAYLSEGFGFIYEYIDHISPVLAGTATLPRNISEKYDFVMSHEECIVVVTAERLKQDVVSHRGEKNLIFASNGVDYDFFQQWESYEFEPAFRAILEKGKPIVMYYGALAQWFDYALIKKLAATGKYSVVLIGLKYDGSFEENIHGESDLYFLGPRPYQVLKYYAREAELLLIPFQINDITRATSPVKIFEYMALHKPIVTTDMDECRQYRSVLIGRDHEEFLAQVERGMSLCGDREYLLTLDSEARQNDWSQKASAILNGLNEEQEKS